MNLESERLVIRKICERDWDDFYEYRSDPKICEFQSYEPIKKDDAAKFIAELKDAEFGNAGEWIQLAIELKSEKKMIGDIGLKPESYNSQVVEFGVSFSTKYQKQGLAKEALTEIFNYLFTEKNIHRIIGIMDVKNVSMIGLIESLKFRREAEFKQSFWDQEKKYWCDEFLYAMLKKDWNTNLK